MLSNERPRGPRRRHPVDRTWLLLLLLLPFLLAACVTVADKGVSSETVAPSPAASVLDPFATPSPVPLATPTPLPTPEPTPEPVDAEVFGFLPNWLLEDAAMAIDTDLLTTVAFHGVEASGDGKLVGQKPSGDVPPGWAVLQGDAFRDLQAKLQQDGVKVVLTVQRFGWSDGGAKRTNTLLTDKAARTELAERIAALVVDEGLDGANLDFEPVPADLSDEYVALVREVRAELDKVDPSLQLSVDVLPGLTGYDLAGLTANDAADFVIMLGYNFRGAGAVSTGSNAPLLDSTSADLAGSIEAALTQIAPDKLVLALPWYGRAWSSESDVAGAATVSGSGIDVAADLPYAGAVEFATKSGRNYDATQASAWTAYPDRQCATCDPVWRQLWYEDPDSFGAKIDYALEQGLAGIGIWALGHEAGRDEMWWAARDRLRPRDDAAPPNGSATIEPDQLLGEHQGLDVVEGSAPLRLFASDGSDGSGLVLARIGLDAELAPDGSLVKARDYPAVERIDFPLGDPETGGSDEAGPRSIHVQWRDIAGNWSAPLVLEVWVEQPAAMETPASLG